MIALLLVILPILLGGGEDDRIHRYYFPFVGAANPPITKKGTTSSDCTANGIFRAEVYYNWTAAPNDCPKQVGVPMIWDEYIPETVGASRYLLLFNECDLASQCNSGPYTMAFYWHYWEEVYPDRLLIGPNISGDGWAWLHEWRTAYIALYGRPPRLYALGYHCYSPYTECQPRIAAAVELAKQWASSGKLWLTEWAMLPCWYANGTAGALADAKAMWAYIAAEPAIETAMWFTTYIPPEVENEWWSFGPGCNTALISNNELTPFGRWYESAK